MPAILPGGLHPFNELADEDDIQEDQERERAHHVKPAFAPPDTHPPPPARTRSAVEIEKRYLPSYSKSATAEPIPIPIPAPGQRLAAPRNDGTPKRRNPVLDMGMHPINTMHGRPHKTYGGSGKRGASIQANGSGPSGASAKRLKTAATKSKEEPIYLSVDSDSDDELSRDGPQPHRRKVAGQMYSLAREGASPHGSSSKQKLPASPKRQSNHLAAGVHPPSVTEDQAMRSITMSLPELPPSKDRKSSEDALVQNHRSKSEKEKAAPPSTANKRYWSNGQDGQGKWSGTKPTGNRLISVLRKHPLVVFQRGAHIVEPIANDPDKKPIYLHLCDEKTGKYLKVYEDNQLVAGDMADYLGVEIDKIRAANTREGFPCMFALEMNKDDTRLPGDTFVKFTMKDNEGAEAVKKFLNITVVTREEKYFNEHQNQLREWQKRRAKQPDPVDEDYKLQEAARADMDRRVSKESIKKAQAALVERNPEVVIPRRRKLRDSLESSLSDERPPKRSCSQDVDWGAEEKERSTRVSKRETPKLQLPKPVWKRPLLYPFEGPKRANVDYEDLKRLNPAELLNDNIINFYLRYLEQQLQEANPELAKETHFLNTYFYARLTAKDADGKRTIAGVLKWTAKIDLFQKNYVIVPINESTHWYLAIICNLQHLERKLQKDHPETPDAPEPAPHNAPDAPGPPNLARTGEDSDTTMPDEPEKARGADHVKENGAAVRSSSMPAAEGTEDDPQVLETQDSLRRMSIDPSTQEWPDEDLEQVDLLVKKDNNYVVTIDDDSSNTDNDPPASNRKRETKGKAKAKAGHKSSPTARSRRYSHSPDTPVIIILDSMDIGSGGRLPAIKNLREWLTLEARNKRGLEINAKAAFEATVGKAPSQNNWYDCGLYVLWYVERFLKEPARFVKAFLARENTRINAELWPPDEVKSMRKNIFDKIVKLHEDYEEHERIRQGAAKAARSDGAKGDDETARRADKTECKRAGGGSVQQPEMRSASSATSPEAIAATEESSELSSIASSSESPGLGKGMQKPAPSAETGSEERRSESRRRKSRSATGRRSSAAGNEGSAVEVQVEAKGSHKIMSLKDHWNLPP